VAPGLPDGRFLNQKSRVGKFLESLEMEDVGLFYGRLVYLTAAWYFCGQFVYFMVTFSVLVCCIKKNLATLLASACGLVKKTPYKNILCFYSSPVFVCHCLGIQRIQEFPFFVKKTC
jgi:hypothetical protein